MSWIVIGQEKELVKLVSKSGENNGLLPKGSFLTVETENSDAKFILRVESSLQHDPFSPSPLVIDMDIKSLYPESKSQNIVHAYRIKDISNRSDGLIDFIPAQSLARRSNQEEINIAFGNTEKTGPKVFPATIHAGTNQLLVDDDGNFVNVDLPEEFFFYQTQICGKTGSGKTVGSKYLAQYFVEKMGGAVLAINVKDVDFLQMNRASNIKNKKAKEEWALLGYDARGVENCTIYYPATSNIHDIQGIDYSICKKVTLSVKSIRPEALSGLLQNISDLGAQSFPDIFRYWKEFEMSDTNTFSDFVSYFSEHRETLRLNTLNVNGDESDVPLHRGTFDNIVRNINDAVKFFDNDEAQSLTYEDILSTGKMSIINVTGEEGTVFGSILLRQLLRDIVRAKSDQLSSVPILVIIDEVHMFYNSDASKKALGELDTICRTGRSQKIGVIFSSQNDADIPKGLSSVINSKFYFKSDGIKSSSFGISTQEISTLEKGYAVANIHDLPQLKVLKFPLSLAGVIEK